VTGDSAVFHRLELDSCILVGLFRSQLIERKRGARPHYDGIFGGW
jgi:hypothetical protein